MIAETRPNWHGDPRVRPDVAHEIDRLYDDARRLEGRRGSGRCGWCKQRREACVCCEKAGCVQQVEPGSSWCARHGGETWIPSVKARREIEMIDATMPEAVVQPVLPIQWQEMAMVQREPLEGITVYMVLGATQNEQGRAFRPKFHGLFPILADAEDYVRRYYLDHDHDIMDLQDVAVDPEAYDMTYDEVLQLGRTADNAITVARSGYLYLSGGQECIGIVTHEIQ